MGWEEINDPHLRKQLVPGENFFSTTRKQCDCGTELGSLTECHKEDLARKLKKLEHKGWSPAKIQRWLGEKEKLEVRKENVRTRTRAGPEIHKWLSFLRDVLESKAATSVGVLLHWGGAGERLQVRRRERNRLADIKPEYLLSIEEDVLYEFSR